MRGEKWLGRVSLAFLMIFLVGRQVCLAGGFALYQGSARGNSLEGTIVARGGDPSVLFFNPAGMTDLSGLRTEAGATVFLPTAEVTTKSGTGDTTTKLVDNVWVTPNFYSSYQYSENLWFGLGVFSQFGLGTEYDHNWPGRYDGYEGLIQSLTVNPSMALKLTDHLSAAVGLDVIWFDITLKQKLDPLGLNNPITDVDQILKGDAYGYGFNAGLRYEPFEWMALGLSYRSQVKESVKGDATFIKPAALLGVPGFERFFNNTGVNGSITLPDMLFTGISFRPVSRLSVEFDAVLTRWSTFDRFTTTFDIDPYSGSGGAITVSSPKSWHDVWRYALGVEYGLTRWLDLRAAYVYDQTPDPAKYISYLTPVSDCHAFSMGPGFHWRKWTLDLSYTYVLGADRDVPARLAEGVLPSELKNLREHLFGMSVAYNF